MTEQDTRFKLLTVAEWANVPEPPKLFSYVKETNEIVLRWGGYDYEIDLDEVDEPLRLLEWIAHIGEKDWEDMTPGRVRRLIETVCHLKNWDLWNVGPKRRNTGRYRRRKRQTASGGKTA